MCVDIVFEFMMIAVIMVIILIVRWNLGCCVCLLCCPALVLITLIHHTAWDQRQLPWAGNVADVLNTPKTNVVLGLPVLRFRTWWILQPEQVVHGKSYWHCFTPEFFKVEEAVKLRAALLLVSLPAAFLFLCNYWVIIAQLQNQQRCVRR